MSHLNGFDGECGYVVNKCCVSVGEKILFWCFQPDGAQHESGLVLLSEFVTCIIGLPRNKIGGLRKIVGVVYGNDTVLNYLQCIYEGVKLVSSSGVVKSTIGC